MKEAKLQNLIRQKEEIQDNLKTILAIKDIQLIPEDTYINGITADFSVLSQKQIRAIIECKGSDIGVNEYVRGIGQILQYSYFHEENISPKGFTYASKFNVVLLFPSSVIKNNSFNIGRFKYPHDTIIIEINEQSEVVRKIDEKELAKLKEAQENNLVTISQYYVRDNRIFEIYLLLKYVSFLKMKGKKQCDRKKAEDNFLKKLEVPNNGNWRNAFISLASLGFIDNDNLPTASGNRFAFMEFEEFAFELFEGYLKPYFEEVYKCFGTKQNIKLKNLEFAEKIYFRLLFFIVLSRLKKNGLSIF